MARPKSTETAMAMAKPRAKATAPRLTGRAALGDAQGRAEDGVVLRPDHHGRHDEDLRVGEFADGGDEAGTHQQQVEADGIGGVGADGGVDHFPHRRDLVVADHRLDHLPAGPDDRSIQFFDDERAPLPRTQLPQAVDHLAGHFRCEIAVDHIPVGNAGRTGEDGDVDGASAVAEELEDPLVAAGGADHADVEHASPCSPANRVVGPRPRLDAIDGCIRAG
jgi:hypothetical protein